MPTTGVGALATGATDWLIEYNRYLYPNSDVLKAAGQGINQWNYYGPLTNYPVGTVAWAAGTTYAVGAYVLSNVSGSPALFRSFSGGNVANAPASTKVDTAFWESLDPHGDANTQTGSNGTGVIHRYNMIDWGPEVVRAVGMTQAIRIVRNTGADTFVGPVDFDTNVIPGPYANFYPLATEHIRGFFTTVTYGLGGFAAVGTTYYKSLQAGNLNNPPATSPAFWEITTNINAPGPIRYLNNWVGAGSGGLYYSGMVDAVDAWSNNRDAVSDALIAGPVLRVAPVTLYAYDVVNEAGSAVITAWPALRVRINSGAWQTLSAAGLTISRTAAGVLSVDGFNAGQTLVEWHLEQEQTGEPYSAVDTVATANTTGTSISAIYAFNAGVSKPKPVCPLLPGLPILPTRANFPEVTA